MKRLSLLIPLLLCVSANGADVVPSDRKVESIWQNAGVSNGIPIRTTVFTNRTSSFSASDLNGWIDNCPSNQVIQLPSGSYSMSARISVDKDGVTIRGATNSYGVPTTTLDFGDLYAWGLVDFSKELYWGNNWALLTSINVSSGLTQGSTQITVASTPTSLVVGGMMRIDQLEADPVAESTSSQGGAAWGRNERYYCQYVVVTVISGTTITFTPPLVGDLWDSGNDPEIAYDTSGLGAVTQWSGLEDIIITRNYDVADNYLHAIHFGPAHNCWAKNAWAYQTESAAVRGTDCCNITVTEGKYWTHDNTGSATYDIWFGMASTILVDHNIMTNTPCAVGLMSNAGSVIAYNATTNFPYSTAAWLPECMMQHGGYNYYVLFEGNIVPSFWADHTHGNAGKGLYVRNRVLGWESGKTASTECMQAEEDQDWFTIVGNVLGTDSYHTLDSDMVDYDANSSATLIRTNNYTTVADGIDFSLGSLTMQDSYYRASKPARFGTCPWPPIDPNTAAKDLLQTAEWTNVPAWYRLVNANNEWPPAEAEGGGSTSGSGKGRGTRGTQGRGRMR